jgi:hypothetical protein
MGRDLSVYDLGDAEPLFPRPKAGVRAGAAAARPFPADARPAAWLAGAVTGGIRSLSLFVPGTTQALRGQLRLGALFASWLVFLALLGRALVSTLDDLIPTLHLLGRSVGLVLWGFVGVYALAAAVHLGAVWTAIEPSARDRRHPVVPGVASLILPGWGQILNGDRLRAVLFLAGLWVVGGAWVASSDLTRQLLDAHVPVVTPFEQAARAPLLVWSLKWTAPLVIWALSCYDAVSTATARRGKPAAA